MNELISIIIPFFNSQDTIEKCIDSILNQTYKNFEIILVDNNSTDSTKKILSKYLKKYKFIKYYNINKQNTSLARNKGLLEANGSLICFIDSDDQVHKDYLKILYNTLCNTNMSVCSFSNKSKNDYIKKKHIQKFSPKKMYNYILSKKNIQGYVWNKMFKSNIIKDNKIIFNESLKIGEDIDFVFEYLKYCDEISFVNNELYYYNRRNSNTVNNIKNFKYTLNSWENMFNKYSNLGISENLQLIYFYYLKKYYEIKYYDPKFNLETKLQFQNKINLNFKIKLFIYKYFTYLIILAKKVRDRI